MLEGVESMDYKIFKLEFPGAVHFGRKDLEDGEYACCADTVFSALCQEALHMGSDALLRLYRYAKEGTLQLSDAFPYRKDSYYIPRPMKRVETGEYAGDSVIKKAYRKLKYIPMEMLDVYLDGAYDVLNAPDSGMLGRFEMKVSACVRNGEETKPYRLGTYYFHPGNGLYVIVGYRETDAFAFVEELFARLSFSGIGGRRSAGLGRFRLLSGKLPEDIRGRLQGDGRRYMSLSVSLPKECELDKVLEGAEYILCKRSGFVASENYAPEQRRKRDLYVLKAGSCFGIRYQGDIYDVSGPGGAHPVYRYAKPMLMEVDA